jgi:hypothetical protein
MLLYKVVSICLLFYVITDAYADLSIDESVVLLPTTTKKDIENLNVTSNEDDLFKNNYNVGSILSSSHHNQGVSYQTQKKPVVDECQVCNNVTCTKTVQCSHPNQVYRDNHDICLLTCDTEYCSRNGLTSVIIQGCSCKSGYKINPHSICVPEHECPKCPHNEVFRINKDDCMDKCNTIGCLAIKKDRCYCKPGYRRTSDGVCVPETQCDNFKNPPEPVISCVGPNEVFQKNRDDCSDRCSKTNCYGTKNRCFCLSGYKRINNGNCISEDKCTGCGPNEVYLKDYVKCSDQCDSSSCKPYNHDGCFCKPGYKRNDYNQCILESQCPVKCGINENYQLHQDSCSDLCDKSNCRPNYKDGCYCMSGYKRDQNGICAVESECRTCDVNEIHSQCSDSCLDQCDISNCTTKRCEKGCFCKSGYRRNYAYKCIPEEQCPKCNNEDEVYTLGNTCANKCYIDDCDLSLKKMACLCNQGNCEIIRVFV